MKMDICFSSHILSRSAANILQMTLIGHMGDNTCAYMWVEYCSTHERNALFMSYVYYCIYGIQNFVMHYYHPLTCNSHCLQQMFLFFFGRLYFSSKLFKTKLLSFENEQNCTNIKNESSLAFD